MKKGEIIMSVYDEEKESMGLMEVKPPSPMNKLKVKRESLEKELQLVNDAILALEENPQIEEVLTKLAKVINLR